MNWQNIAVAIIAVVVAIIVVRRLWRFFTCRNVSGCASCEKNGCPYKK